MPSRRDVPEVPDDPPRKRTVRVVFEMYEEDPDDDETFGRFMFNLPAEMFGLDVAQATLMEFQFYRTFLGSSLRLGVEKALADADPESREAEALRHVLDQLPPHALPPIEPEV